jgi:hypothetical protein
VGRGDRSRAGRDRSRPAAVAGSGDLSGDLPAPDADESTIQAFALTTNGYDRLGSFKRCAGLAEAASGRWRRDRQLPATLADLRCCLFFEQRRWRHYGYGFDDETLEYARALVEAMRPLVART